MVPDLFPAPARSPSNMNYPARNPRRAYNADGREIPPMTLGNTR
jgi:hypothetical protein